MPLTRADSAALLILASLVGCNEAEPDSTPPLCRLAEPVCHDVRLVGCDPARDECPVGTVCAEEFARGDDFLRELPESQRQCAEAGDFSTRCVIAGVGFRDLRTDPLRALVVGFNVGRRLRLARSTEVPRGTPATFDISGVEDARIVSCAVFTCPPIVVDGRIVNFDNCVHSRREFEPPPTEINLASLSRGTGGTIARRADCSPSDGPIGTLLLGCWAYDSSRIIAATPLEPLTEADFEEDISELAQDCEGMFAEGLSCAHRPGISAGGFGTCRDHSCRGRCVIAADCPPLNIGSVGAPDAGPPAVTCQHTERGYVGTCVYGEAPP